jgi:hypothetical protein
MKPNAGIKPKNGSSPRLMNPKTTRSTIYSPRSSGFLILSPASYPSGRDIRSALPSAADSQGSGEGRLRESMRIELFLNGETGADCCFITRLEKITTRICNFYKGAPRKDSKCDRVILPPSTTAGHERGSKATAPLQQEATSTGLFAEKRA